MKGNRGNLLWGMLVVMLAALAGCGGGSNSGSSAAVTGGTFGTGGFSVTVSSGSIPASVKAAPTAKADSGLPAAMLVSSYETNVTAAAKAYTLTIGSSGFRTATVGAVRLEVPFDRTLVPDQSKIDSLHLLLRIYNADDKSVVTLTGQQVGNKIVADLTGFPSAATVSVLFNPNMEVVTNDPALGKTVPLTGQSWATRKWAVVFDSVEVGPEIKKFLGISATPTPAQIRAVVKEQLADHAADAAAIYAGEGFRAPNLYAAKTAAEPGGLTYGTTPRYLIHYQKEQSANFTSDDPHEVVTTEGNHYGRVYIQDTDLNEQFSTIGMSIYGTIAHELFHAIQNGYDLSSWSQTVTNADCSKTDYPPNLKGIKEGTATAYGDFLDRRHNGDLTAVPQVRQYPANNPAQIQHETLKLGNYLLNSFEAYANQDFFVYLARTIGNNNFKYLATLFEQIRLTIGDDAAKTPNPVDFINLPDMASIYKGVDAFLAGYSTTLLNVQGDFVRQRAIEHNNASLFGRAGETVSGLARELFNNYAGIVTLKEVQVDPTSAAPTTVNDLSAAEVLSTRAIRITPLAGKAKGDLTVTVAPGKGAFGTTLSGWIYRKTSAAAPRTAVPLLASNSIAAFGENSADEVIILLVNPSFTTGAVGISCEIKGTPATNARFVDKGNGTIYDTVSKLTWLKKADCFMYKTWDEAVTVANALASGQCGLTDASKAGDWHLPTIAELRIFVDDGYTAQTLNQAGFTNVQYSSYYWSATASSRNAADPTLYKYYVNLSNGSVYDTYRPDPNSVLPVR